MVDSIPAIRNTVRAVIVENDAILVQHKCYEDGSERYTLPGGAQDPGETLEEGLQRECLEEIGTRVEVADLIHVADYDKPRDTEPPTKRQQVEFFFDCSLPRGYLPGNGPKPDRHQVAVVWLSLENIGESALFPPGVKAVLTSGASGKPVYLGKIV